MNQPLSKAIRHKKLQDTPEGEVAFYVAWDRIGKEHYADTPLQAGNLAYHAKAPGRKRKPVLIMARKRGSGDARGKPNTYSVPMGYYQPESETP